MACYSIQQITNEWLLIVAWGLLVPFPNYASSHCASQVPSYHVWSRAKRPCTSYPNTRYVQIWSRWEPRPTRGPEGIDHVVMDTYILDGAIQ
jgi:hypothetical protein